MRRRNSLKCVLLGCAVLICGALGPAGKADAQMVRFGPNSPYYLPQAIPWFNWYLQNPPPYVDAPVTNLPGPGVPVTIAQASILGTSFGPLLMVPSVAQNLATTQSTLAQAQQLALQQGTSLQYQLDILNGNTTQSWAVYSAQNPNASISQPYQAPPEYEPQGIIDSLLNAFIQAGPG